MGDALRQAADGAEGFNGFMNATSSWIAGMTGTKTALGEVNDQISNLDQALAQMDSEQAATLFAKITTEARRQGVAVDKLNEMFPEYTSAVKSNTRAIGSNVQAIDGQINSVRNNFV